MKDKEHRKLVARLIFILRKKKILDDKDMEELFGKPEETILMDCYKVRVR